MQPAIESLKYQGNELHTKIAESIRFLRVDNRFNTQAVLESLFSEHVRIKTGMKANLLITDDDAMMGNACVVLPTLSKDHPFQKAYGSVIDYRHGDNGLANVKAAKLKATIDLANSKVGGIYSDIVFKIYVGKDLMETAEFSPEELSAIIVHELGHAFTYLQCLDKIAVGAVISTLTARELAGIKDPKQRSLILTQAEEVLGYDIHSKATIIEATTDEDTGAILMKDYCTRLVNTSTNNIYDFRHVEQMADHFAVKHGAGHSLAMALQKLMSKYGHKSTSKTNYVLANVTGFSILLLAGIFVYLHAVGKVITLLCLFMTTLFSESPSTRIYDEPEARLKYIRASAVQDLAFAKELKDKEMQATLIATIDGVDDTLNHVKDRRTWYTAIYESLPSPGRTRAKQEKAAKQLESLMFNELRVNATRFELVNN